MPNRSQPESADDAQGFEREASERGQDRHDPDREHDGRDGGQPGGDLAAPDGPADFTRVGRRSDFAPRVDAEREPASRDVAPHADDEREQGADEAISDIAPRPESHSGGFDDDSLDALDPLAGAANSALADDAVDDAYELQDHEFTLVVEDPTLEIETGVAELADVGSPPPLPPWAAVSKALLDNALDPREDQTIEIPPPEMLSRTGPSELLDITIEDEEDDGFDLAEPPSEAVGPAQPAARASGRARGRVGVRVPSTSEDVDLREQLANATRHSHAREVYLAEVERALASANGKLRGQSFRIAELEQRLQEAPAAGPTRKPRAKPPAKIKPRAKTPAKRPAAKSRTRKPVTKTKRAAAKAKPSKRKPARKKR